MNASEIIDRLGGTTAVAELCKVKPPSVSEWREKGIPRARLMFLQLARPDVFDGERCVGADQRDQTKDIPHVMPAKRATNGHKEAA